MISIVKKRKLLPTTIIVFVLIVSVILPLFSSTVSANEIQIFEENDELVGISTEADYFYYNDKMLLGNIGSTSASGEIALASIGLAEAAYDEIRVSSALDQMGFSILLTSDYYNQDTTHDDNDVVAYSIAEKYVNYGGELYRMIVVPIRGTCETCEWYSNFNIGSDEMHRGFNQAAWKVLGRLSEYLYDPTYNVQHTVIWTMGHSRGAAVANIIAGEISTGNVFSDLMSRDYVFGYTFACPTVSTEADTSLHNIFNYNNGGDLVPAIPLSSWGFERYGQTIELPASDYDNLCQRYKAETGEDYQVGMTTVTWEALLEDLAATREEFVGNDKIQLAVDIIAWDRTEAQAAESLYLRERRNRLSIVPSPKQDDFCGS